MRPPPLLLALALLPPQSACGGWGSGEGGPGAGADVRAADTVEVRVAEGPAPSAGRPLHLRLVLRNPGTDTLRLEFSSGQRFDFAARVPGGEVAWRWSEGRFFTQALGGESVPPGDSLVYEATLEEGLEAGPYIVVGTITARGRSLADTVRVEVGRGAI